MNEKTNAAFEAKRAVLVEYYSRRRPLEKAKDEAMRSRSDDEYHRLSDELKKIVFPMTEGEYRAVRDWERSTDTFICRDYLWERDIHDYIEALRDAGVIEFLDADESTAVMRCAHGFVGEGAKLEGTATFTEDDGLFKTTYLCLRFSL